MCGASASFGPRAAAATSMTRATPSADPRLVIILIRPEVVPRSLGGADSPMTALFRGGHRQRRCPLPKGTGRFPHGRHWSGGDQGGEKEKGHGTERKPDDDGFLVPMTSENLPAMGR